nr:immunoglobulin heavy chain junction region [Mus musculus]MBK4185208.1 immunoglobulin heavy chain junction region [Mus musculus]MBK4185209.1 immunoglobulin heavy chain junction region [Mus musculus]MBK4185210.1 immunoglobulin heavy chain junction region [Mus musculus]MBK4185211.1 immunoglobulin heavy chain junction region [Mus musculus]
CARFYGSSLEGFAYW